MMDEAQLLKILDNTELCTQLKEIGAMYKDLEEKQKVFCDEFNIHCIDGCGRCCEHFIPDVSTMEADYLAFGLIAEGRDEEVLKKLSEFDASKGCCPFYDWNNDHHCTVYRWRALICRLFGAAASKDKEGRPVYRNCRWNPNQHTIASKSFEQHPDDLVVMGDYGLELTDFEADDKETSLLPQAVINSMMKIRLMLQLEHESQENQSEA